VLRHELIDAQAPELASASIAAQWIDSPAPNARRQFSVISGMKGASRCRFAGYRKAARS
jgi:hypothetical protein